MLVSVNWLKKYVTIPVDTQKLTKDLTMIGDNVETCTAIGSVPPGIVIGHVLDVSKHPNADRLRLCRVNIGEGEPSEIVCGAPNVAAGQCVPVALPGIQLPNGVTIRKSKIRGIVSNGMICSEIELGLGQDAAGIIVLDGEYAPGTPFEEALPPPDEVFEVEVTPNRPDLLSIFGIAREVAALYRMPLEVPWKEVPAEKGFAFDLEVTDGRDCPRYVGRMIRGVKVGPSPAWLVSALESVGLHSINNVVDITNYVLMETGQPLHAFDFDKLRGGKIIVRRGERGERIAALNGEEYDLTENHLIIADGRGPVAIAGVIGGIESSVTEETKDVLLESACFEMKLVRRTRKSLGLSTEASYRFERGVDREMCRLASDRVCELLHQLAGGKAGEVIDVYEERYQPAAIDITRANNRRLLGVDMNVYEIVDSLERLGFRIIEFTDEKATVEPPAFRLDIGEEADLIEEVGRMYGYDRIGTGWSYRTTAFAKSDPFDRFTEKVADFLCARGLTEVVTSSFTDGSEAELWQWPDNDPRRGRVKILNPLNVLQGYLRTSLIPGMIEVIRRNMAQGLRRINIFEVGKTYSCAGGRKGLPEERLLLGLVLTNPDDTDFWYDMKKRTELFDIKKEIELLAQVFGVDIQNDFRYVFDKDQGEFVYKIEEEPIIEGGIVPGQVADKFDFDQPVWYASLDLNKLYRQRSSSKHFSALPEYPVSKRDLSLVAGGNVEFRQIEKALVNQSAGLLESLLLFDVYRGENIPEGKTAYGVRMLFRSKERTLTDEEIDGIIDKMISKLGRELNVVLRS